jgi:hypothetical protein
MILSRSLLVWPVLTRSRMAAFEVITEGSKLNCVTKGTRHSARPTHRFSPLTARISARCTNTSDRCNGRVARPTAESGQNGSDHVPNRMQSSGARGIRSFSSTRTRNDKTIDGRCRGRFV